MAFDAVITDPLNPGSCGGWSVPPLSARIACGVSEVSEAGAAGARVGAGAGPSGAAAQQKGDDLLRSDPALKRLMFNTYNMGIGFVIALAPADAPKAAAFLEDRGFPAWEIGRVATRGDAGHLYFA
jgi:phosphoribosylformylglycinamidine cyclo-ligase